MNEEQDRIGELAIVALRRFGLDPNATATLCNVSENHTYRVDDPATGSRFALRVHRPGYHSVGEIDSELTWLDALRADGVVETPSVLLATDGRRVVSVRTPELGARNVVLFEWLPGAQPDLDGGDAAATQFETLGAISARMHSTRSQLASAGRLQPAELGLRAHARTTRALGRVAGRSRHRPRGAPSARASRRHDRGATARLRPRRGALRPRPRRHPSRQPAGRRRARPGDRLRRLRVLLVHVRLRDHGLVHGGPPARARAARGLGPGLPLGGRARRGRRSRAATRS